MNRKIVYTISATILLVALYVIIFCFSADDGEASSVWSEGITRFLMKVYYCFAGKPQGTGIVVAEAVSPLEGVVRKTAHFAEYACMGFLSYSIVILWYPVIWKGRLMVALQVLLSAVMDELHQYFVPGRYAAAKDVLIDFAGGIAGIFIIICFYKWKRKRE